MAQSVSIDDRNHSLFMDIDRGQVENLSIIFIT